MGKNYAFAASNRLANAQYLDQLFTSAILMNLICFNRLMYIY